MKNRSSIFVKVGRLIQKIYYYFSFMDNIFTKNRINSVPVICIIGTPRSGSTLAYQVLTEAFENNHLTNFTNLFYATPILGFKIQKILCQQYKNKYHSNHGFVSGFCGESEGLKFWDYWCNQGLEENNSQDKIQLKKLHNRLKKIDEKPFITGYVGLSFSMDFMRNEFNDILFVYIERDMLSTCYSFYKFYNESSDLMSLVPKSCIGKKYDNKYGMVFDQIKQIQACINRKYSDDCISISYEELCENPNKIINKIQDKATNMGIKLKIKNKIPSFKANIVSKNLNNDTEIIYNILKN